MANGLASSFAALGIALAPALLKFGGVPNNAGIDVDEEAIVACVAGDSSPVHSKYLGTHPQDHLPTGAVVQVTSKRNEWRHIAYVTSSGAAVGWIKSDFLEPCKGTEAPSPGATHPAPAPQVPAGPLDTSELETNPHVMLGLPTDDDPSDDILLDHGVYVVSYNPKRNDPNWVAWKLQASDLGDQDRQNNFRADDALPDEFLHVTKADYNASKFDRGHMCPSAHRTNTAANNSLTFLMTNMEPQVHALNAGPWKSLETFERKLVADEGKDVYVVAGGIFPKNPALIGPKIAVPSKNFRVTVVLNAKQKLDSVNPSTPVYAVEMPNDVAARGHQWSEFRIKLSQLEEDTGYDFLSALPDDLEKKLAQAFPPDPG